MELKKVMTETQIKRIQTMEARLDEASPVISELSDALQKYEEIQSSFYELSDYYGSSDWMADYEADERGEFPADLKRGVLSEDTVYDLITEHKALMARLQKAVLKSMEEDL